MVGSSILPVAIHNSKLYFLFGKENSLERSAPGYSDFGGGVEKGESPFDTAIREGSEELTGFLGTPDQIKKHIKSVGGTFSFSKMNADNSKKQYTVHVVKYPYDPVMTKYYNNNHSFLWDRMNRPFLKSTNLFEKSKIDWFCEDELKKRMSEYRPFYREVVDLLLEKIPEIKKFLKKSGPKGTRRMKESKRNRKNYNKTLSRRVKKMKGG